MPPDAPLLGRTLAGRYTITGRIGGGGFSTVYRGVQERGEPRDVAIKVMNPELARDGRFLRRFRREAKAAVRLDHPSSVRVLEYGVDGEVAFIAMELLIGEDLFETLARERRLPEARAARIVAQICDALGAAHDQGIIHRDLKPENIMLLSEKAADGAERVKVLDFGVAKILHAEPTDRRSLPDGTLEEEGPPSSTRSALTRAGTVMGTPAYMAPEQGRAEAIDHRSDLYACGVVLYQLVTGRLPFSGETPLQVVMQHVHETPRPPTELVPSLNRKLEATILRALAKWPAERHDNAAELAAELRRLLPALSTRKVAVTARDLEVLQRHGLISLDTPVGSTPQSPASDSTRTMIRDVSLPLPERVPTPPPHHLDTAPTPLVIAVPRGVDRRSSPGPLSSPALPSAEGPPAEGKKVSTLRSRLEDIAPDIAALEAKARATPPPPVAERASVPEAEPPSAPSPPPAPVVEPAPITVRRKPRLSVPAAVTLGVALGVIAFGAVVLVFVLMAR